MYHLGWITTGNMRVARKYHTASILTNGKVLVVGGYNDAYLNSAELYDPSTGIWTIASTMNIARECSTASILTTGTVLVTGGDRNVTYLNKAELY
jgi:N-acetylneuraminic acid mutarotase